MSNIVTSAAESQLGKPYVWDTPLSASDPNPKSFDCSGLTMWCYHKAGVNLPHYSAAQYLQLKHRPFSEAMPGDLVFYSDATGIYHVCIYMGGGQIIEAPETGIPVRYRSVQVGDKDLMANVGIFPGGQQDGTVSAIQTAAFTQTSSQATTSSVWSDLGAVGKFVSWITTASNWRRIGEGVLATIILMLVLYFLFQ